MNSAQLEDLRNRQKHALSYILEPNSRLYEPNTIKQQEVQTLLNDVKDKHITNRLFLLALNEHINTIEDVNKYYMLLENGDYEEMAYIIKQAMKCL